MAGADWTENQDWSRHLLDNIPAVSYRCQVQAPWRVHFISDGVSAISGRTAAEFLREGGLVWSDIVLAEDLPKVEQAVAEGVAHQRPFEVEYRIRHADGTTRWVFEKGRAIYDTERKPVWLDGVIMDVTAAKQAEETSRQARHFSENLIRTANVMVIGLDTHGHVTVFNEAAEKLTGYRRAELVNRSWFEVLVPKDRYPHVWAEFERLLAGGLPTIFENPILTNSGQERLISWRNSEIREGGKIVGTISFGIDLTERRRMEEALAQSEAFNRGIIESSRDCIKVLDLQGRLKYMSPAGQRLLNIPDLQPYLGMFYATFWAGSDKQNVEQAIASACAGNVGSFTGFCATCDGTPKWWDVVVSPILDPDGKVQRLLVVSRDITERKYAEEALAKALLESKERHAEVAALLKGSRAVLRHREFPAAGRAIFNACKELIGATAGYVALLSKDGTENQLLFLDAGGRPCTVDPSLPMPIRGLRAEAYRSGRTVYENQFAKSPWKRYLPRGHVKLDNALFAPLVLEGQTLGLLGLADKPGGFTENDARLASAFAEQATLALQNSRNLELLENSEQHFRSVAQTAGDAVITADAKGNIAFWNRAAEKIFGYRTKEVLGSTIECIIPNGLRQAHRKMFSEALSPGSPDFVRKPLGVMGRRKDGSEIPLELSLARWKSGDKLFCTAIIRDVTDRKKAEDQLRRAHEELENRVRQRTADLRRTVEKLQSEITVRQQAEKALAESEERYRTLFESAPIGIALSDLEGKILDANNCLCAMMGVSLEEAKSRRAATFYKSPAERQQLVRLIRKYGTVDAKEVGLKRGDGSNFSALLQMSRVQLSNRKVLLTVLKDITEHKRAEKHVDGVRSLLELFATESSREEYLNAVIRLLRHWCGCRAVGIRLVEEQGRLAFAVQVGFSRAFLKQESHFSLHTGECACLRVLRGKPLPEDVPCMNLDGSFFCNDTSRQAALLGLSPQALATIPCFQARYQSIAHIPIRDQDQILGTIHLTDRQKDAFPVETIGFLESVAPLIGEAVRRFDVETSLQESELRFRSMFESHRTIMLLVDPKTGAVVDANPASARFFGYARGTLCTMNIRDLHMCPHFLESAVRHRKTQGASNRLETTIRLASGETRTVEVHSTRIRVRNRPLFFAIIHDITERKVLEKQVLDISEKERQRVGRDLHDSLGGKLTGAALLSKALSQTLAAQSLPEAAVAEEIVQCVNEAIAQTRSIAHGLCPVELDEFGFLGSLREFAAEVERRFSVSCRLEAPPRLHLKNTFAASHLFRIVQESVSNALRHGKARSIIIALRKSRGQFCLQIRDDGVGLPANFKARQGLGLRTMKHRAETIGGQFAVAVTAPRGTLVSCSLPLGNVVD